MLLQNLSDFFKWKGLGDRRDSSSHVIRIPADEVATSRGAVCLPKEAIVATKPGTQVPNERYWI